MADENEKKDQASNEEPDQNQDKDKKKQLNIELPESVAEGTYVNLALITHSNSEFVFDLVRVMPGVPKAKVKTRAVMNPSHAKRLLRALSENIAKYESQHGEIKEDRNLEGIPMNFGGPKPEA